MLLNQDQQVSRSLGPLCRDTSANGWWCVSIRNTAAESEPSTFWFHTEAAGEQIDEVEQKAGKGGGGGKREREKDEVEKANEGMRN